MNEMVQDSEKRFHSIMDKLFLSPKSLPSSSSGSELVRGRKRPNPASSLAVVDQAPRMNVNEEVQHARPLAGSPQAPQCRPWDRGDLVRRLSTFKAMTWFAKPKAVSAVNCARRGWVNVDMDTIACEACGTRLLFSTPSSWSQQQVEKAALVFSLKLDNGHKLLCPWVDNACDESLAQFPPKPPQVLVDEFKGRFSSLVQLLALPVISSSSVKFLRSPQLESFLQESSALQFGNGSPDISLAKCIEDGCDKKSATFYYQALMLISLCGWEPRLLPYMVTCKGADVSDSLHRTQKGNAVICTGNSDNSRDLNDLSSDPQSVVLDCKLCGASVGLWAFSTVMRPVENFRFVGFTELTDKKNDIASGSVQGNNIYSQTSSFSIAGGPPPAQQNFKAMISLPVIGRSILARFCSDSDLQSHLYLNQADNQSNSGSTTLSEKGRESAEEPYRSTSNDHIPSIPDIIGDSTGSVSNHHKLMEGTDAATRGTSFVVDSSMRSISSDVGGAEQINNMTENAEHVESVTSAASAGDPCEESRRSQSSVFVASDQTSVQLSDRAIVCEQEVLSTDNGMKEAPTALIKDSREGITCTEVQNTLSSQVNTWERCGDDGGNQVPAQNGLLSSTAGKSSKQLLLDERVQFDPIRQHRHFCPWIASTGSGTPGWQQTLSALQRETNSPPMKSPSSASLIKVDDPITSVRRLFTSKRMKSTQNSS